MSRNRKNYDLDKVALNQKNLSGALKIFRYIRPHLGYFIAGMVLLVVGSLVFMVLMGIPGEMANVASGTPRFELDLTIQDFGKIMLILLVIQGVFSYFRTVFFTTVSERGMADLRKDLYNTIMTQSITFFEQRRVGELTSRITADVEQLQSAFSVTLAEFLRQLVILISGIAIIAFWTPKLSLIMLLTFPIIVVSAMFFGRYIRKLSKKRQDELAKTNTVVEETLQSFQVVKSFANEWYESVRYGKAVDRIVKISLEFAKVRGLFFSFIITVLFGGIFYILYQGALMVENDTMEVGDLFSFIIYTGILGGAIASFGTLYATLASAVGATERVQNILDSEGEINLKDSKEGNNISLAGDIVYKNVQFSYPTRKEMEILKGVDLKIAEGQKIALVGQSGSGKSTIVSLLMKFYPLDGGEITINGTSIQDYNITHLRQNIGIVPQEVILFGGTIKENILYGNPNATEEELIEAAKKSNSFEFIESFPDGFETIVGERGIKLSGGQRQRIAIARAILKDPRILLLDEATSSLDAESERLVQEALDALMEGRTSIIIAHRLATIRDVDQIYVLEDGEIVENGTHAQLMDVQGGAYRSLAQLQFS
ncbi:MAG: ABC transporter transmembrane domain-containing protein [Saprospiraceae bacterium]|nr:ABC transporter transmembrane domain-containing protein [Saprospiraceae bacterium]